MKPLPRAAALALTTALSPTSCGPLDAGPPPPAGLCPIATHGPTHHQGDVQGDEVWRAEDGPHFVTGDLRVRTGARLTIEPCATVELAPGASIEVIPSVGESGRLVAEGSPDRPIVLRRSVRAEPWGHLLVRAPGAARLAHVTLDGGGAGDLEEGTLRLEGDGVLPSDPVVSARELWVKASRGVGVRTSSGARFSDDSAGLTVVGAGARPARVDPLGLVAFPAGSFVLNARDEIQIDTDMPVLESVTLRNLGVPYHAGRPLTPNLVVGGRPDDAVVTLGMEPGVVLRMQKGGAVEIEAEAGRIQARGALVAIGTASAPIVLTSDQDPPRPGDWRGLWFGGFARPTNRVEHVRLEYTGAACGCLLVSCTQGVTVFDGAVLFTQQPPSVFIKESTLTAGRGHGFVLGYSGIPLDFAAVNTIESVAGCPQTMPLAATCAVPECK